MGKLDGKVAIITGAAGGQGAAHAKLFIEEGAKVVVTDIDEDNGKEVVNKLGDNAYFIKHDVTSEDDWKNVIKETENHFGPVNVLVNNAGMSITKLIEDISVEEFDKVVAINQKSVFLGMKYVYPSMKKTEKGSIINISSQAGVIGNPRAVAYGGAKFAVTGMTKTAALEFSGDGIRVNSVHPGVVQTPFLEGDDIADMVADLEASIPLGEIAEPEQVSKMIVFLASDDSDHSTGSEFMVDGGMTAG